MEEIRKLESRLKEVENKLSGIEIAPHVHEMMSLMAERNNLASEIERTKWRSLSNAEKIAHREQDFAATKKYYDKYGDEVRDKYLFKMRYIDFIDKVISANEPIRPILSVLYGLLNSAIYMDIHMKSHIDIVMNEVSKINSIDFGPLQAAYEVLVSSSALKSN